MSKSTTKQGKNYTELSKELDDLLAWFDSDEPNLDEAVGKYEQAMELIAQMETHLKSTEISIKKISAKFKV